MAVEIGKNHKRKLEEIERIIDMISKSDERGLLVKYLDEKKQRVLITPFHAESGRSCVCSKCKKPIKNGFAFRIEYEKGSLAHQDFYFCYEHYTGMDKLGQFASRKAA